uniref:Odorant receptor n=1 Tax=Cacopsylla melanoneura TaxID=428564 RepID=A0A8D9B7P8_9HEMI
MTQHPSIRIVTKEERVTKYLDFQLNLLNKFGLFNLPGSQLCGLSFRYSNTLFMYYMGFAFVFYGLFSLLSILCIVVYVAKDFVEFFTVNMEVVSVLMVFVEIVLLNMKRDELLMLLNRMNSFDVTTDPKIFTISRRIEKWTWICYGSLVFSIVIIKFSMPLFPISSNQYEHFQRIYELKNPQNKLPLCLWVPSVDTSEPVVYNVMYFMEFYPGITGSTMAVMETIFVPFVVLHLVGQHFVLSSQLKMLGKTSMEENSKASRPPMGENSKKARKEVKAAQEIFQIRKCILFHQNLIQFRSLVSKVLCFSILRVARVPTHSV